MGVYDEANEPFKVRELWRWRERFTNDFERWQRQVDLDLNDVKHMGEEFKSLKVSVDSTRKTVMAFAYTVAGSSIVFAFSVLVATGKVG